MARWPQRRRGGGAFRSAGPRQQVLLRLYDWTEWSRQVFRGVQGFAHSRPNWLLQVITGPPAVSNNVGSIKWDGILTHVASDISATGRMLREGRTRIVSFTAHPHKMLLKLPAVRVNEPAMARTIGQHLLSGGFRRFAYCHFAWKFPSVDFRGKAVREFAQSVNCTCDFGLQTSTNIAAENRALTRWLQRLEKPVGIFAWNMAEAVRIVRLCLAAHIPVPQQVAVVSWDDDPLLAVSISPTVSGAVVPAERLGYEAATLLDRLLDGAPPPVEPIIVEPSGLLHVRQSSDVSTIADRDVHLAVQFIQEHAAHPLGVKQLVSELQISRSKLERDFHRVTGKTMNQMIVAAHLDLAKQLLVETRWPLDRLAKSAGFGSKQHFHRTFLRVEGITPAQYRRQFGA